MTDDIDKEALKGIMNGIADAFDRETPDTIKYKTYMEADKTNSNYDIFNTYEMAAGEPVHIVTKIIKAKFGIKRMDDELYWFIRDFPSYIHKLEKEIEKAEGYVCCVDKAWQRSMKQLQELIDANVAKESV